MNWIELTSTNWLYFSFYSTTSFKLCDVFQTWHSFKPRLGTADSYQVPDLDFASKSQMCWKLANRVFLRHLFHSCPILFHSCPILFHSRPILFHSRPILFHSCPTLFHSCPILFHTCPILFHFCPILFQRCVAVSVVRRTNPGKGEKEGSRITPSSVSVSVYSCLTGQIYK